MQFVKCLLLGSAAGLVAVAGAEAADLPVKAKPVEYVKVCSLYGAGFWYVPGTDTCLKIGSFVRVQTSWNNSGSDIPIGAADTSPEVGGRQTRSDTANFGFRVRSAISLDLRTQTEYGTLRSYLDLGAQWSAGGTSTADNIAPVADTLWVDRGFIQFAGFTAGRIRSYFDINSFAPYGYSNVRISGDTGALGIYGIAYTAQFGNGITATISFEDNGQASGGRGHRVDNMAMAEWGLGTQSHDNKGQQAPDVVGALRIDQAWGYAQVSAALHDSSGGYYGTANSTLNGHPADKMGFATSGGFTLTNILGFKGDTFGMQGCYSVGSAGYCTRALNPWQMYSSGNNAGFGWVTDGVYDNTGLAAGGSNVELTTVWGINGAVQHLWSPKWRTSLYGGYVEVDYNGTATNIINQHLPGAAGSVICGVPVTGPVTPPLGVAAGGGGNACSPDFSWWQLGTRTQWNPHPDLDIGVDVLWTHLNTAYKGSSVALAANGARPAGLYTLDDQDIVSVMFRIQRNFLP
jgi:Porin subfamily